MKILFMCVANSARSQMAEGLARKALGPNAIVQSAGSHPTHVNPLAIQVMKEIGIDIAGQSSKSVSSIDPGSVEIVVTLCAEEVCPAFWGGVTKIHWPFPDPADKALPIEEQLKLFRKVRDGLQKRITDLAAGAERAGHVKE